MTLVNIDLRNQGYETSPGDRVIFYSLLVREGDFGTISTAPVEVELADGKASVDLAPGPVGVQIIAKQIADTRVKIGEVPPSGATTLNAVMMVAPAYTPALQKMMVAAVERAKEVALEQVDAEVSVAINAEVGEAIYSASTAAQTAASEASIAGQAAASADARATAAESKSDNAVSRVTALEVMGGLSPGEPADGQTANLIAQESTLTRNAVNTAVVAGVAAVSVRNFGALGNGVADDTDAINAAIDHAVQVGIGRVIIPDGTYMIRGHIPGFVGNFIREEVGIILRDNIHLDMSLGATLKCIPTSERQYNVINILNRKNVIVTGGRILGERHEHTGTTGEWGYGISVQGGENIEISGTRIFDCWGDGINVQRGTTTVEPKKVRISGVECAGNRRQGMSVEAVIGLSVTDSIFRDTGDTFPGAGVDVEPLNHSYIVEGMIFKGCTFANNSGPGLLAMMDGLNGLTVEDCFFEGNLDSEAQLKTYSRGKNIFFLRNTFKGSGSDAIRAQAGTGILISDNEADSHVRVTNGLGDYVRSVTIRGNQVSGNIVVVRSEDCVISQNRIQAPSSNAAAMQISASKDLVVSENVVTGGSRNVWIFDGYNSEAPYSESVSIVGNVLKDAQFSSVDTKNVQGVDISGNRMLGCGSASAESQNILITSGSSGVRVHGNVFEHGKSGQYRTRDAIRWTSAVLDTVAHGNRMVRDGAFPYSLYRGATLQTGYIGNELGVMAGATSSRPTQPEVSAQFFDTTLGKMLVWNGAAWANLDGTPLAAP